MEKQTKPAPDAGAHLDLAALRCARAELLLASLRWPRALAPTRDRRCSSASSSSSSAAATECAIRPEGLLHRGEVTAARHEAAELARLAASELLLVLAVAPVVLMLLLLLGLL